MPDGTTVQTKIRLGQDWDEVVAAVVAAVLAQTVEQWHSVCAGRV